MKNESVVKGALAAELEDPISQPLPTKYQQALIVLQTFKAQVIPILYKLLQWK